MSIPLKLRRSSSTHLSITTTTSGRLRVVRKDDLKRATGRGIKKMRSNASSFTRIPSGEPLPPSKNRWRTAYITNHCGRVLRNSTRAEYWATLIPNFSRLTIAPSRVGSSPRLALILSSSQQIQAKDILFEETTERQLAQTDNFGCRLNSNLRNREQEMIVNALRASGGSRKSAATALGISARTLRYKLSRMRDEGISIPGHSSTESEQTG